MPSGLREHPRHYQRLPDLLRGRSHQWQSLQGGVDEHRRWLLQEEERSSQNPVINLGPALNPMLAVLVLASAVAAPVLAEESGTFKEQLLYCEDVGEHDDDFNIFRQYFEACITASY